MYHVGIDWADQKHDLSIIDQNGKVIVTNWSAPKSHKGFEKILDRLRKLSINPQDFKVGIETPHNLLVDFLVDLGYPVFSIFPGSMKSFRKRYRSSNARDDNFDAFVLADVLRTDKACWRLVDFGSDSVRELRLLARDHHSLVRQQTALINSLRSTLKEYYPEYIHFFSDIACASSLAFILAYSDFESASQLTREQLISFFKVHKFRNTKTINKIYERLHDKHLIVPAPLIRIKKLKAASCAQRLSELDKDIKEYSEHLKKMVEQHPDGKIFFSYPGVSYVMTARLLAIFGDNRKLYDNVSELQGLTGTCPVTEKSGKGFRIIYFRRACNKFYRDIIRQLAFSSLQQTQWAKVYYQKHRARGKKNSHALRCLGNIHLRILFAMWKNRTCYDENVFLAQRTRQIMTKSDKV